MPEAPAGLLLGKKLRVLTMNYLCGKESSCVGHNIVTETVTLHVGDKLEKTILKESDVEVCNKEWLRPVKWKSMVLSRYLKQNILSACGALKLWLEDSDDCAAELLEEIKSKKPQMLLDSHMLFGWELLRWHFSLPNADFFAVRNFFMLDPVLSGTWLLDVQSDFVADKDILERERC